MSIIEVLLIGIGLSMDAFAAAVCKGLASRKFNFSYAFIVASFFGVFQAPMPCIGWLLGKQFQNSITEIDHWIAFILLVFVGGKMLYEALTEKDEPAPDAKRTSVIDLKELAVLAVATSIDALAVGITFAFLDTDIISSSLLIGLTTFIISAFGFLIGVLFGTKFKTKAEIAGGIILILIGVKILLEHMEIINF